VPKAKTKPRKVRTTARRRKIAAGLIAGKAIAQVARETGISRQWASREAQQPETRIELAGLLGSQHAKLERLVARAVAVIGAAMGATKVAAIKDGGTVDLGADHYARLQAVKRLLELIVACKPLAVGDAGDDQTLITMDRLRAVFERGRPRGR
jgi:hypothetical protein